MPKATVSSEPIRRELRSAPPDGFVSLKPLTYGQWLHRNDIAGKISYEGTRRGRVTDNAKMIVDTFQRVTRVYDLKNCVIEHNLTDEYDKLLDFTKDNTIDRLDPRIGAEIGQYLDELHEIHQLRNDNGDEDEGVPSDAEVFTVPSSESSQATTTQ